MASSSRSLAMLWLSGFLLLSLGFLTGAIFQSFRHAPVPIVLRADTRMSVPIVIIDGVENGSVVGRMEGDVRLFLGDDQVMAQEDGSFHNPAGAFLTNRVQIIVPTSMRFVASKRGRKYYPVDSSGGANIAPQNRLYFRTAEEAEGAGYRP